MKHLILGNGPTGVVAAEILRRSDPGCEIIMAGDEQAPPYSRMAIPYLLEGNIDESGTYLRKGSGHFDSLGIRLLNGRAVSLNPGAHEVRFADGHSETYDRLLIATGSRPLRPPIPGVDLPQVQTCWTLDDARAITALARPGARVLQLGAGFIGCIVMEALAKRGVALTVVELGDRMVPRMMTPKAGAMIKSWVEGKGIRVITSAGVERIDKDGDAVTVKLSTGEECGADLVIVAAGVAPNASFLEGTGVNVAKGILVDGSMETSVPGIYAAGDVAEAPDLFTGAHFVAAIQPNAADQARVAALGMAGRHTCPPGVLAINVLNTVGLISTSLGQWWGVGKADGGSGVEHVDAAAWRYLSLQFKDDVLIGATAIGLTEHVGVLRGLIQNRLHLRHWKDVLLENPTRFVEAYIASSQPASVGSALH